MQKNLEQPLNENVLEAFFVSTVFAAGCVKTETRDKSQLFAFYTGHTFEVTQSEYSILFDKNTCQTWHANLIGEFIKLKYQ